MSNELEITAKGWAGLAALGVGFGATVLAIWVLALIAAWALAVLWALPDSRADAQARRRAAR